MRWLGLAALLVGCGTDDGAILTFEAPAGIDADRVQIVLASADPQAIGTGVRQRVRPGGLGEEDVVYYRQRARGGMVSQVETLDGLVVRIEPELDAAPDEQFIPFALVFDAAGELVAVGSVNDPDGNPMPVIIREEARSEYALTVTALAYPGPDVALAANEGLVVGCLAGEVVWTSGVAWRPAVGPQLRLLLADRAADPTNDDATGRMADLDCDTFDAAEDDCDDLRSAYHPEQAEACDGLDTDCDGRRMEVQECPLTDGACGGTGVALCVDQGANAIAGACRPDPACACITPNGGACARCMFDTRAGATSTTRTTCAPAVGKIHYECDGGACDVEVVDIDGPFEIELGAVDAGPFGPRVTGLPGHVYLRASYHGGDVLPPGGLASLGTVYLAVTNTQLARTSALNVDLEISDELAQECRPGPAEDTYAMYCQP